MEDSKDKIIIETLRSKLDELKIDHLNSYRNVYSAIIAYNKNISQFELISLGTGIKCLPDCVISDNPDELIHDMHAEVVCRRSFISFIFVQLLKFKQQNIVSNDYLLFDEKLNKHYWNPDLDLLFYSSQSPCKKKLCSSINF